MKFTTRNLFPQSPVFALICLLTCWAKPLAQAATLSVTLSTNVVSEAAGINATFATIRIDPATIGSLPVAIIVSDIKEISVPTGISIAAGSNSVSFPIDVLNNDGELDGTRSVTLAVGVGLENATATLMVTDDDTPALRTLGGRLSGTIPPNTYTVIENIVVEPGRILTIAPSAVMLFTPGRGLFVNGTVIADGKPGMEIRFASTMLTPTNGSWEGIQIGNSGQARSILECIEISHARNGLLLTPSDDVLQLTMHRSVIWGSASNGVEIIGLDGGFFLSSSNVQIFNNEIFANQMNGVYLHSRLQGCGNSLLSALIVGNRLFGNGRAGVEIAVTPGNSCTAIRVKANDAYIAGNVIYGNASGLIASMYSRASGQARSQWSSTVENNFIFNNSSNGVLVSGSDRSEIIPNIVNNTIVHNGQAGVAHGTNVDVGFALQNNIIALNQQGIVASSFFSMATNVIIAFNDVWSNGDDWINYPPSFGFVAKTNLNGTPMDAQGNISVDPLFVGSSDYHLQPDSPAVDAGTTNLTPTIDFEGQSRYGFPDMGYDELATVRLAALSASNNSIFPILVTGGRGTPFNVETTHDLRNWTQRTQFVLSNRNERVDVSLPSTDGRTFFRMNIQLQNQP